MRKLKAALIIAFILTLGLTIGNGVRERFFTDRTAPVFSVDSDAVTVDASLSIEEQKAMMLTGITAADNKDGDVTSNIRISSLSRFNAEQTREVNYIVFDSSDNAATYTRVVSYVNYTAPQIHSEKAFRFNTDEIYRADLLEGVTAVDCLDGDISGQVHMTLDNVLDYSVPGEYKITLQVSNSGGDTRAMDITLFTVENNKDEKSKQYPLLSDYFAYTAVNVPIDPMSYIIGYESNGNPVSEENNPGIAAEVQSQTVISSNVDYAVPGVYFVDYTYTDDNGDEATARQYLIVDGSIPNIQEETPAEEQETPEEESTEETDIEDDTEESSSNSSENGTGSSNTSGSSSSGSSSTGSSNSGNSYSGSGTNSNTGSSSNYSGAQSGSTSSGSGTSTQNGIGESTGSGSSQSGSSQSGNSAETPGGGSTDTSVNGGEDNNE